MSLAEVQAAQLTGTLWAAICAGGGPRPASRQHWHYGGAFDPAWLAQLALPVGADRPPGQPVAFLEHGREGRSERHTNDEAIAAAYARRARTRVDADIGYQVSGTWYALAALPLARLAGGKEEVLSTVSRPRAGDESRARHRDSWYGAVVQLSGAKEWRLGEPGVRRLMLAGDVLLVAKYLPHVVTTPSDPGHSVHLAFMFDRDVSPMGEENPPWPDGQDVQEGART